MGKDKLKRFAEVNTFSNVLQLDAGAPFKGQWNTGFFKNTNPVVLELACGKGEYTVNLATLFPDKNFIGIGKSVSPRPDIPGTIDRECFLCTA